MGMKGGLSSPFSNHFHYILVLSSNLGLQGHPISLSILQLIPRNSPIGKMDEGHFELDQPYKQTESKMLVTGKISTNKVRLSLCDCRNAQGKYANSINGTARCSLTLKN